ncbi:MAG: transcriptional regulator NrdR, partial [Actinobacteria bacterium]|nr:transcriptional regulator NrdR [Actinomycetota bacterium]
EDFEGEIALLRAIPSSHSPAQLEKSNSPITENNVTTAPQSNKTLMNQNN